MVIDCSHVSQADFTAAEGFRDMIADFSSRHQPLYWMSVSQTLVETLGPVSGDNFKVITLAEEIMELELSTYKQKNRKEDLNIAFPILGSIICSEGNTRNAYN